MYLLGFILAGAGICFSLIPFYEKGLKTVSGQFLTSSERFREIFYPWVERLAQILAYGKLSLTPKQFFLEVIVSVMCFPIIGRILFGSWVEGVFFGGTMATYAIWRPFMKYKRRQEVMLAQFQSLIVLMVMSLKQGGRPYDALRFAAPNVESPLQELCLQAILRMENNVDTLSEGVHWLADQTGLSIAKQWANQIVQTTVYNTETVHRLLGLVEGQRKRRKQRSGSRNERKRITSVVVAISFIGIPIVLFVGYISLHSVLLNYQSIPVH